MHGNKQPVYESLSQITEAQGEAETYVEPETQSTYENFSASLQK